MRSRNTKLGGMNWLAESTENLILILALLISGSNRMRSTLKKASGLRNNLTAESSTRVEAGGL